MASSPPSKHTPPNDLHQRQIQCASRVAAAIVGPDTDIQLGEAANPIDTLREIIPTSLWAVRPMWANNARPKRQRCRPQALGQATDRERCCRLGLVIVCNDMPMKNLAARVSAARWYRARCARGEYPQPCLQAPVAMAQQRRRAEQESLGQGRQLPRTLCYRRVAHRARQPDS